MVVFTMIGVLVLIAFLCLSNGIAALTQSKPEPRGESDGKQKGFLRGSSRVLKAS